MLSDNVTALPSSPSLPFHALEMTSSFLSPIELATLTSTSRLTSPALLALSPSALLHKPSTQYFWYLEGRTSYIFSWDEIDISYASWSWSDEKENSLVFVSHFLLWLANYLPLSYRKKRDPVGDLPGGVSVFFRCNSRLVLMICTG